ncbi:unnamed protein product [Rotaria sp. Silwood1]|nr:unnamed protein product [Rotaria sp. Silwood1]
MILIDYFFEYLLELSSSSCCLYDVKTKLITNETKENLFKLIDNRKISIEKTNRKVIENYNNYLNRYDSIDIIDIFYHLKLESSIETIILSINNIKNDIDRLFFEYLLELSSPSCCIYDVKTKLITIETKENLFKLINTRKIPVESTNRKNSVKHTLCTYLSLLLDIGNKHALLQCLTTPAYNGIERNTITELRRLSKNECSSIYQILLSFLRRKELILNHISSSQLVLINNDDKSFHLLDKYYIGIKEFFDFIEQLQMIIEENKHSKIESIIIFRKLLGLILKQLCKDTSITQNDLIIKEILEEFCQCFQTIHSFMTGTTSIRSASSDATLANRRCLQSIAYLCAKQIVDSPVFIENNDHCDILSATTSCLLRFKSFEIIINNQTIHSTMFDNNLQLQSIKKRQP